MLDASKDQHLYKYGPLIELSQFALAIFSLLYALISLLFIYDLFRLIFSPTDSTFSIMLRDIGMAVAGIVWVIINWISIYSSPAIEVTELGLCLKVFPLKTFSVQWDDIAYVREARWKPRVHKKYGSIVVVNHGLTRLHRFCGIIYGGPLQPSFVILPNISDYDDLLKVISDGVKKSRRSTKEI